MKSKFWKKGILGMVLIITSPVTIGVWLVNDKTLGQTFGEIIESNKEIIE